MTSIGENADHDAAVPDQSAHGGVHQVISKKNSTEIGSTSSDQVEGEVLSSTLQAKYSSDSMRVSTTHRILSESEEAISLDSAMVHLARPTHLDALSWAATAIDAMPDVWLLNGTDRVNQQSLVTATDPLPTRFLPFAVSASTLSFLQDGGTDRRSFASMADQDKGLSVEVGPTMAPPEAIESSSFGGFFTKAAADGHAFQSTGVVASGTLGAITNDDVGVIVTRTPSAGDVGPGPLPSFIPEDAWASHEPGRSLRDTSPSSADSIPPSPFVWSDGHVMGEPAQEKIGDAASILIDRNVVSPGEPVDEAPTIEDTEEAAPDPVGPATPASDQDPALPTEADEETAAEAGNDVPGGVGEPTVPSDPTTDPSAASDRSSEGDANESEPPSASATGTVEGEEAGGSSPYGSHAAFDRDGSGLAEFATAWSGQTFPTAEASGHEVGWSDARFVASSDWAYPMPEPVDNAYGPSGEGPTAEMAASLLAMLSGDSIDLEALARSFEISPSETFDTATHAPGSEDVAQHDQMDDQPAPSPSLGGSGYSSATHDVNDQSFDHFFDDHH